MPKKVYILLVSYNERKKPVISHHYGMDYGWMFRIKTKTNQSG
jgi:hypothetical protein